MQKQKMVFVTRHTPTAAQFELANNAGFYLTAVGDFDAFAAAEEWDEFLGEHPGAAVAVVHPQAALTLLGSGRTVAVFENVNRAPEGERPQFTANSLSLSRMEMEMEGEAGSVRPTVVTYRVGRET